MYSCAPTSDSELLVRGCVAALGCFDGLHIGHRALLARAKKTAQALGLPLVVYSPESRKGQALLTTAEEKTRLLYSLGADRVILADFDSIKALSPETFVQMVLIGQLNCRTAVCGYNFSFGHRAAGNSALLSALLEAEGRCVLIEDAVDIQGISVSSTRIRNLLTDGEPEKAAELLLRPYSVSGKVEHGRAIGRTLGFPTLNLTFPTEKLIPKNGVYYSRVHTRFGIFGAVSNIGVRPTFQDSLPIPVLESHLLNFSKDLYNETVTVELVAFLRPEKIFTDSTELANAVHANILDAQKLAASDSILQKENITT